MRRGKAQPVNLLATTDKYKVCFFSRFGFCSCSCCANVVIAQLCDSLLVVRGGCTKTASKRVQQTHFTFACLQQKLPLMKFYCAAPIAIVLCQLNYTAQQEMTEFVASKKFVYVCILVKRWAAEESVKAHEA